MNEEEASKSLQKITRMSLYGLIQECPNKSIQQKLTFMEEKIIEKTKCPEREYPTIKRVLSRFKSDFKKKWTAASHKEERFLKKNELWLSVPIKLSIRSPKKQDRQIKNFCESNERSKRRKTKDLRVQVPLQELTYAARMSQRAAGNADVSKIIKDITETTPTRASKFRKVISSAKKENLIKRHSPSEALAIFVEGNFTRRQWEILHSANKNIYPCYSHIKDAKKVCYPNEESIQVTETCAEIQLQALLDHTISRLLLYLEEVIEQNCTEDDKQNLELITKWGCDGSKQCQFKQKFSNSSATDANIFLSSLVPLKLRTAIGSQEKTIWQNPFPSSPRFCRPIRIRFIHETNDVTNEEIQYIEDQAKSLSKTEIPTASGTLMVKHTLVLTMVDAKVCHAATETSSTMRCYICGKTSKNFNNLNESNEENPEAMRFGLSILHARIRFFESLLHLSYKIPIKTWQARSSEAKEQVKKTKENIQRQFKEEMGLLVDIPKAGAGNTNDGNTSRRFFADPETSSQIINVDINLIKRFKIILEAMSSCHRIDVEKFAQYTKETAELYVELYGWYPITPTVHKILIHGTTVIKHAILPIGQLSEEAAEARNKHFRLYRQNFSRKFSQESCNKDVLNRLLLTSDPFLSSIRKRSTKKCQQFSKEVCSLLLPGTPNENEREEAEESEDSD